MDTLFKYLEQQQALWFCECRKLCVHTFVTAILWDNESIWSIWRVLHVLVHNEHMEFYTDSLIISAVPLVIKCKTCYEYIKNCGTNSILNRFLI